MQLRYLLVGILGLLVVPAAGAHTDSDLVAVAAGARATVTLQPTHGCAGSPTTKVSTRVPVTGATAGEVAGWTATAAPDAEGRTVLEWTGGRLPADAKGAFPVTFKVPDRVGELLLFPFVQECEDGTELAWIDGDPKGEEPAPRLLVLPAGSRSAGSIEEVPADAPGRDQLAAVVDVDNPAVDPAPTTTAPSPTAETTTTPADAADDDGGVPVLPIGVGVVVLAGLAGLALRRSRR